MVPTVAIPSFFHWHPDPGVVEGLVALSVLYWLATGPARRYLGGPDQAVPRWQALSFHLGTLLVFFSVASPLDEISEKYLFCAHMLQHVILLFPVPVLWLLGTPGWIARLFFEMDWSGPLARFFTRPAIAFTTYTVLFYVWHLPGLYEWALRDNRIHFLEHAMFMGGAILQWWPLIGPYRSGKPLHPGLQLFYLLAGSIAQYPLFFMLGLSDHTFYPTYINAPRMTFLSPYADQQMGAIVMKIASMLVMFIALAVIFGRWYVNDTRRGARPEDQHPGMHPPLAHSGGSLA